jgi:hypothetical protein
MCRSWLLLVLVQTADEPAGKILLLPCERIGLTRILGKSLRCGDKLRIGYVELTGKFDLQLGFNLAKKNRHVTRHSFGSSMINKTMN